MNLKKCMLTANRCYKQNTKMTNNKPTGIVVHSTGANNKTIKRYVQPLKTDKDYSTIIEDVGKNLYGNHWNRSSVDKCVHAFIGTNKNGDVVTYQNLPWDVCCWGCASGKNGSYNKNPNARIQFEICEDNTKNADYFDAAFKEAIELCAYLCEEYNIPVDKICSHKEAYKAGYGSNHGDPEHWMKNFGKDMAWFRDEVEKLLGGEKKHTAKAYSGTLPTLPSRGYFKNGDKGTQVKNLQKFLNWCLGNCLVVDGVIGGNTTAAVKIYQRHCGLAVDGLFGKDSLAKAKTIKK